MAEKADKITTDKRIRAVAEYIIQGHATSDIVQNIASNWSIEQRQAYNYISKAYELIKANTEKDIQEVKAWHVKARMDRYRDLVTERKKLLKDTTIDKYKRYRLANQIETRIAELLKDLARIDALYVEKIELKAKIVEVDWSED